MKAHEEKILRESAESFILRAGEFEQAGSSIDEYAVLIEGLRAHYDNYELFFMLGLYYRYRNADQAFLCFENALHYCDEPEDEKVICDAMADISDRARVRGTSIVIVSYNDFELIRECIRAIRRYVKEGSYEIIVVDNASSDDELKEYLRSQAKEHDDFVLIENSENAGFPAGCNIGLAHAKADNDVFFLNNDAVLMPNALFWLKMGLYADKRNGSSGAVTNCAPSQEVSQESLEPYIKMAPMNDARPLTDLPANLIKSQTEAPEPEKEHRWWRTISLDSAIEASKSYAKDHNVPMWNPYEVRTRLTGFALLLKRDALSDVIIQSGPQNFPGIFDERFTPGYFEDDDLGIRLCLAGWRQVLCHNAFIYHHGGSGFAGHNDAMEKSRDKFGEKWGFDIWNYTLPEEDKISALMSAISADGEASVAGISNSGADVNQAADSLDADSTAERASDLKLYNRVIRILDLSAGMGTTLSFIKYLIPGSFTAGITNADVFAGLSKYMADDIISGDPELVTFPWPAKSFDYILAGDVVAGASDPERLLKKLSAYLNGNGKII
ncbi:glycosyltransferase family 2 protein [Butyrivibrio sp. MB2005]|uniref:glycosyltransferase family 2 protein n=1 Tax=Butyrivibrio sp. MB2005 TaxID=1280678 RepID=UPI000417842B|nr:glycosyltransferase family 2 protein [Butyrivibrio sp. MB2005]